MTDSAPLQRPNNSQIARSAMVMIGVLAFAKLFSLSEKWIGLDRFGIGIDWDTFAVANQLPEQLYVLLAGGGLSFAFIPVFSQFLTRGDRDNAWKLASNVLNTVLVAVLIVGVLAFAFAPTLIANVIAPGFARPVINATDTVSADFVRTMYHGDLVLQTATLMRILLLSLIVFSISGLVSGILYTHQNFFLPALTPIMFDVGNLFGVLVLARFWGVYGAAIGAVIGSFLHLAIQVPGLIRLRARWMPLLNWRDPHLREVIRLMIPRSLALGLANLNLLIAYNLASTLGSGSVASFNRGWTLMQLPETLIGTAMGIVIFPTLALLSASGDLKGKRAAMSGSLRFILIASIPAAVAMVLAGRPLVGILEGGQFDQASANRVFSVLQFWALGIVTHSLLEVVARSFFADKDMITPLVAAVVETVLYVSLGLWFIQQWQVGVAGLALANSVAVGVELLILLFILRRRWQGIDERQLMVTTVKALLATVVMGAAMVAITPQVEGWFPASDGRFALLAQGLILVAVGGVVYVLATLILRVQEVLELPKLVLRRRAADAVVGD